MNLATQMPLAAHASFAQPFRQKYALQCNLCSFRGTFYFVCFFSNGQFKYAKEALWKRATEGDILAFPINPSPAKSRENARSMKRARLGTVAKDEFYKQGRIFIAEGEKKMELNASVAPVTVPLIGLVNLWAMEWSRDASS